MKQPFLKILLVGLSLSCLCVAEEFKIPDLEKLAQKAKETVDVTLDGKRLCEPVDLRAEKHAMHEVRCGAVPVSAGKHAIAFTVVGKSEKSSGYDFGLDAVRLVDVEGFADDALISDTTSFPAPISTTTSLITNPVFTETIFP